MNRVTLNGIKSNTIKGLLIQSLPPISKPLMRTQIEEIDGRDGDIVTKLGYSAYDKEMSIGLFGDYNVDDVIRFFDSEGEVIFSNEPEKYYKYQIIEQIDFERLLRYKTANVNFHVQPFKYSAVDRKFTLKNQFFDFDSYSATKNGITMNAHDGVIHVSGTGSTATEFYMPIKAMNLNAGNYTLSAKASGTRASACSIRLIDDIPSNANSFGGNYLGLQNNSTATMSAALTGSKKYNYLWFYITSGNAMDFELEVELVKTNLNSISVINRGNIYSKPKITLYGSGTIHLSLNGVQIFVINLAEEGQITIDSVQMNAYQGETLMNRSVVGNYDNLVLPVGTNTISWTGNVTGMEVEDFTRWI